MTALLGHTATNGTAANATADRRYGSTFELSEDRLLAKVSAYLDGNGSGSGTQVAKALVYNDDTNALVATSSEVSVLDGQAAGWVDFSFAQPTEILAGNIHLSLHYGGSSTSSRYYTQGSGSNLSTSTDTYSDGPADPLTTSFATGEVLIYATLIPEWTPPTVDNLHLATYGYNSAQTALGAVAPDPRTKQTVVAGWHGTYLDPQPQGASLAVVQKDGELSDYVGARVQISTRNKSVVAYIHRELDLDLTDNTQISLSRRIWQQLAPLATDSLLVTVQELGPEVDDGNG
jgi:hypothetical protein